VGQGLGRLVPVRVETGEEDPVRQAGLGGEGVEEVAGERAAGAGQDDDGDAVRRGSTA
jgi:hypothetical protein